MPPDTTNTPTPTPQDNDITVNTGSSDNGIPTSDLLAPAVDSPPPSGEGEDTAPAEGTEAEGTSTEAAKKAPWFQRRIDQLTAEKWEERRTADNLRKQTTELLAQLAESRRVSQPAPADAPTAEEAPRTTPPAKPPVQQMSDAEINAMAEKRAEEISRQRTFNKACNDVAEAGKDEYPDFDRALGTFQMLGGIPTPLLEVITEMPNAHKILYSLGKDPDLAERVVKMSPGKQALELARLENAVSKPVSKPVSSAPAPVKPIDANSRGAENPENMSMDDFVKWREKNLANRRK